MFYSCRQLGIESYYQTFISAGWVFLKQITSNYTVTFKSFFAVGDDLETEVTELDVQKIVNVIVSFKQICSSRQNSYKPQFICRTFSHYYPMYWVAMTREMMNQKMKRLLLVVSLTAPAEQSQLTRT